MKNKSPQLVLAGWILVVAFLASAWSVVTSLLNFEAVADRFVTLFAELTSRPMAILELILMFYGLTSAWIGLACGIAAIRSSRRIFAIVGGVAFAASLPVDFVWMMVVSQVSLFETLDSMLRWGPAYWLGVLGSLLAVTPLVVGIKHRDNISEPREDVLDAATVDAVLDAEAAARAQRPILRYDTVTGQPIYAEEEDTAPKQ